MVMENLEKSGYFKIVWKSNKQSKVMEFFLVYICFSGFALSARKPNPSFSRIQIFLRLTQLKFEFLNLKDWDLKSSQQPL